MAVWNNKQEVVHELIVGKAAVNIATNDGQGPLHLAARKGYDTITLELLDGGAAIDMQDNVSTIFYKGTYTYIALFSLTKLVFFLLQKVHT